MVAKRIRWTLACTGLCAVVLGQDTSALHATRLIEQASLSMAQGRPGDALRAFEQAFRMESWQHPYTYYEAVDAALAAGDTIAANTCLRQGIQHGFDLAVITGDDRFQAFLAGPSSAPARNAMAGDRAIWAAKADSTFIKELDSLAVEDQRYRRGDVDDHELMRRTDSLNFEHLIRHCDRHGFPDPRTLGHAIGDVHLLLWHHRGSEYPGSSQWQRMLPHIRQAMADGRLAPSFLAMFDDHADFDAGRPMRYGALLGYFAGYPEHLHFIARDQLNAGRAAIGLGPIEAAAIVVGVDLSKARFAEH